MSILNTTYRIFTEKLGGTNPSQFVGNEGDVFYDPDATTPTLKLSNGSTPGGVSFAGGGGGNANTGDITFDSNYIIGTGIIGGGYGLYLVPGPDFNDPNNTTTNGTQYIRLRAGDDASHIHFDTADNSLYDWYFGDDGKYVMLSKDGPVRISSSGQSGSSKWIFNTNNTLKLAGGSSSDTYGPGTYLSSNGSIAGFGNANNVIFTASHQWMTTVKLIIQAETTVGDQNGNWDIQATELLLVKSINGPSILASVVHNITTGGVSNDKYIANYSASLVDGKITVTAEPIGANLFNSQQSIYYSVYAVELFTND